MADAAFVHPSAVVDEPATIGADTKIWHFVHVAKGARIGRSCTLGQNVYVFCGVGHTDARTHEEHGVLCREQKIRRSHQAPEFLRRRFPAPRCR